MSHTELTYLPGRVSRSMCEYLFSSILNANLLGMQQVCNRASGWPQTPQETQMNDESHVCTPAAALVLASGMENTTGTLCCGPWGDVCCQKHHGCDANCEPPCHRHCKSEVEVAAAGRCTPPASTEGNHQST